MLAKLIGSTMPLDDPAQPLGRVLSEIVKETCGTQIKFSEETGVKQSTVSNIITGNGPFSRETFERIVNKFDKYTELLEPYVDKDKNNMGDPSSLIFGDSLTRKIRMEKDGVSVECLEDADPEKMAALVRAFDQAVSERSASGHRLHSSAPGDVRHAVEDPNAPETR